MTYYGGSKVEITVAGKALPTTSFRGFIPQSFVEIHEDMVERIQGYRPEHITGSFKVDASPGAFARIIYQLEVVMMGRYWWKRREHERRMRKKFEKKSKWYRPRRRELREQYARAAEWLSEFARRPGDVAR